MIKNFFLFVAIAALMLLMVCLYNAANAQDARKIISQEQYERIAKRDSSKVLVEHLEDYGDTMKAVQVYSKEVNTFLRNPENLVLVGGAAPLDQTGCRLKNIYKTPDSKIKVLMLGDGFTDSIQFFIKAASVIDYISADNTVSPYKKYWMYDAKYCPSVQTGISNTSCYGGTVGEINTRYSVTANYGGTCRLFYARNQAQAAADGAGYDYVLIISNTTLYGGSGGLYPVASLDVSAGEIMIHEFIGHRFAGARDEYRGSYCTGQNGFNVAPDSLSAVIKFGSHYINAPNWKPRKGANYSMTCWYCGQSGCKMEQLGITHPFCPVCSTAIVNKIKLLAGITDPVIIPPTVIITPASAQINLGQSATLTASGADTYVWSNGLTMNPITVSPTVNSTYSVTGTKNGLTGTSTSTVNVTQPPSNNCTPFITATFTPGWCTLRITTTKTFNQFRYCQHHWTGSSFVLAAACNDYKSSTGTFPYAYLYTEVVDNDPNILTVKIKQRISASRMKVTVQDLGCSNKLEFTSP